MEPINVNANLPSSHDGFRVRDAYGDNELALWLELRVAGHLCVEHSRCVWRATSTALPAQGAMQRQQAIWQAIARYLNAGGTLPELSESIRTAGLDLPAIDLPGYFLATTEQEVESVTHVFVAHHDYSQAIYWEEDVVVEPGSFVGDEFEFEVEATHADGDSTDLQPQPRIGFEGADPACPAAD